MSSSLLLKRIYFCLGAACCLSNLLFAQNNVLKQDLFITPEFIEPTATQWNDPHYISYHPNSRGPKNLFLFLPGTTAKTWNFRLIADCAVQAGYYTIVLSYPNSKSVNQTCQPRPECNCHEYMRKDIITGSNLSPLIDIRPEECIIHRLDKLLLYLSSRFYYHGWGTFYSGKKINWDKIIIAGHSQGGGHAAMLGKMFSAKQVLIFASGDFNDRTNRPAPWLSTKGRTPLTAYFALGHNRDRTITLPIFLKCMGPKGLGLAKKSIAVDSLPLAGKVARLLTTNKEPAREAPAEWPYHNSPVMDEDTPKSSNGTPVLQPVWQYMMTVQ